MDSMQASAVFLMEEVPGAEKAAWEATVRLSDALSFLPWPDRARAFDRFAWEQAKSQLGHEHVTAVINRQAGLPGEAAAVGDYARFCGAVVAASLIALNERRPVQDLHHALIRLVSLRPADVEASREWLDSRRDPAIGDTLAGLPGLAFLILTVSSTDSALSFTARDAFWEAMLGRA